MDITFTEYSNINKYTRIHSKIESRLGFFMSLMEKTREDAPVTSNNIFKEYCEGVTILREFTDCLNRLDVLHNCPRKIYLKAKEYSEKFKNTLEIYNYFNVVKDAPKKLNKLEESFLNEKKYVTYEVLRKLKRESLQDEMQICHNDGWFMLFDTLTAEDIYEDKVFSVGSKEFSNYSWDIRYSVGKNLGFTRRETDKRWTEFYKCFPVKERGAQGKYHIHCVHFFKVPPVAS